MLKSFPSRVAALLLLSTGWSALATPPIPRGHWHLDGHTVSPEGGTTLVTINISISDKDSQPLLTVAYEKRDVVSHAHGMFIASKACKTSFFVTAQRRDGYYTTRAPLLYVVDSSQGNPKESTTSVSVGVRFLNNGNIRFHLGEDSWSVPQTR
jgi:hypothetical protein